MKRRLFFLSTASAFLTGCFDFVENDFYKKNLFLNFLKSKKNNFIYLEQFFTGFSGSGMRAEEKSNLVTETSINYLNSDLDFISVDDKKYLIQKTSITIKHANNIYWSYKIKSVEKNGLIISSKLKFPLDSSSSIERTWFNRAHPGKFYIRQLVQRVSKEIPSDFDGKIVLFGDSWVSGDLGSTPEREPMHLQFEIELPKAKIVNKGVGGDKITDIINRFDRDVASEIPNYVVINIGTNDAYNPASVIFSPNAVDYFIEKYEELINKINAIGAVAIVLGVPALAEIDEETNYVNWILNDRAKDYARSFENYWELN